MQNPGIDKSKRNFNRRIMDEHRKDMAYKYFQIKIHCFKSHFNCHASWYSYKGFFSSIAAAWISKLGTCHLELYHYIIKPVWEWAEKKGIHITAARIPGHKNINAYMESSEISYDLEWMLCPKSIHKTFEKIEIKPRGRINLEAI